jgi:hypothetical protein
VVISLFTENKTTASVEQLTIYTPIARLTIILPINKEYFTRKQAQFAVVGTKPYSV